MFERLGRLSKYIVLMNNVGMDMLVEVARDIVGHKKYRKDDNEMTPEQFNRSVDTVLAMVARGRSKSDV